MKISKRFNTILFKLSASFVAIIIFSVLLTGVFASMSFRIYSNSQIISKNEIILNDTCEFIDKDILTKADELYLRFVLQENENSEFSQMVNKDEITDYRLMNDMKQLLSQQQVHNSEWMSNMAVYFPNSDLFISSTGILYQKGEEKSNRPVWIEKMVQGDKGFYYYPTTVYDAGLYAGSERICMLIRPYPMSAVPGQETAYIVFGVGEDAISKILEKNMGNEQDNVLLIVDGDGNVISASSGIEKYEEMKAAAYWKQLEDEFKGNVPGETPGFFTKRISGTKYVFSYQNIDKYNWKIINIVPEKILFKGTRQILLITVMICLVAMLLAFFISGFFTRRIYNPVKSILNSALRAVDKSSSHDADEYGIINSAISQMEDYNNTIEQNRILIKYNFVHGIINGKFDNEQEIKSVLKLCEKGFEGTNYTALMFTANRNLLGELTVENRRFIMFKMIEIIEGLSDENVTYFAAEKDEYSVIAVAAYKMDGNNTVIKDAHYVNDYMFSNYYIPFYAVTGEFVSDATKLELSGKSINEAMEYRMFMSGMNVIVSRDVLKRQSSREIIPDSYLTELKDALNNTDIEKCTAIINNLVEQMTKGSYSAAHCNTRILETISVISGYLHRHNIHTGDGRIVSFENVFYASEDIYEIEKWMIKVIEEALEVMSAKKEDPAKCIVQIVKEYIEENISTDLSLNFVAQKVHMSSSYLSKVFKDETGVNFNNYVTGARMEKAADMLLNSDMSVEGIASELGYNTPHYFIKKFRQQYGTTPKNYRLEHIG